MERYLVRSSSSSSLNSKRPAEVTAEEWRTPKRYASRNKENLQYDDSRNIQTHNKFEDLPLDTSENVNLQDATQAPKKSGHIPPILLDIKKEWTHESIRTIIGRYCNQYHLQYRSSNKVAIICYTPQAHQAVKDGLRNEDISFLTYTRKDEKSPKIVMRGLPAALEKELPNELSRIGFKEVKVTKLKSQKGYEQSYPPFLIQLPTGVDIIKFRKVKYILNCVVTMQKYKPNFSMGTQCFRCQDFGHSSKNCNMPPRCVKCAEPHSTAECTRKDRSEVPRCCNCEQDHPANYSKCSARIAYLERLHSKRNAERKIPAPIAIVPSKSALPKSASTAKTRSYAAATAFAPLIDNIGNINFPANVSPPINEDSAIKEMLDILSAIKSLKNQFLSCTSPIEKVMLVLSHLGQYV